MNANTPFITYGLIAVTALVSWLAFKQPALLERLIFWPPAVERRKQWERFITHGFIHADMAHLLFNMITLYFFGRAIEAVFVNRIGAIGFLLFYLAAIAVAILPSYLRHRGDTNYRSLGASGAVSAVLFSFILFAPWSMIVIFIVPVPAILYAVFYVGYSFWMDRRGGDHINHSAHLAGAVYGVVATLIVEPRALNVFFDQLMKPSFG